MSEAGSETLEDEWQSISEIASTCNTILESLSREGQPIPERGDAKGTRKSDAEPEPRSLSEKVSHLESMLRKLQDDLQKVTWRPRVAGTHRGALGAGLGAQPP